MEVEATAACRTDAAPLTQKGDVAEQRWLDREDIEASHIALRVPTLEHKQLQPIGSVFVHDCHGAIIAPTGARRPTQKLNR
jgi:hypothetical protein